MAQASKSTGNFFTAVRGAPPDWYFIEGGRTYPIKATWAHADGSICPDFNTNESKRWLAAAGYGSFINLTLNRLHASPGQTLELSDLDKKSGRFGGGESDAHLELKEWVSTHPSAAGISASGAAGVTEFLLPSGDRIDVMFDMPNCSVAVEVKPKKSPIEDLNRGLFQVIKYRAVLEALARLGKNKKVNVRLAIGGSLPLELRERAKKLGVTVVENVTVGKIPTK